VHLKPIEALYHDVPQELAEKLAADLRPQSVPVMSSPCQYTAWKHIPTTYLLGENDKMISYERQKQLIEDAGVPIATYTCDAGHSPFVSQPEFVAKVIRRAAGEDVQV
jgi:pimeloyl-ACP methyl ester carboxylesterase